MTGDGNEPSQIEETSTKSKVWAYVATFLAGIAVVLLFFIWIGIPSGFESYAHRNDSVWQQRNHPTTTTTVRIPERVRIPDDMAKDIAANVKQRLTQTFDSLDQSWMNALFEIGDDSSPFSDSLFRYFRIDDENYLDSHFDYRMENIRDYIALADSVRYNFYDVDSDFWSPQSYVYVHGVYDEPGLLVGFSRNWDQYLRKLSGIVRRVDDDLLEFVRYDDFHATAGDKALLNMWRITKEEFGKAIQDCGYIVSKRVRDLEDKWSQ